VLLLLCAEPVEEAGLRRPRPGDLALALRNVGLLDDQVENTLGPEHAEGGAIGPLALEDLAHRADMSGSTNRRRIRQPSLGGMGSATTSIESRSGRRVSGRRSPACRATRTRIGWYLRNCWASPSARNATG
jgi:hypothetical protein